MSRHRYLVLRHGSPTIGVLMPARSAAAGVARYDRTKAAILDAAARLADAGLERAPVEQAIERIVRALTAVGDRYAVLAREQVEGDPDEIERLVAAPMRAVFVR